MLKKSIEEELNRQVNEELYSYYIYLAMVGYFESEGWKGMASWMRIQADEEMTHARKIYNYIISRGSRIALKAIAEPPGEWDSVLDAFRAALKHEEYITGKINDLVDLAVKENDHASRSFLQWFIDEQVEEEENVGDVVRLLERAGDKSQTLFMVDKELAGRQPATSAEENA